MATSTTDETHAGDSDERHLLFRNASDFWKQVDACQKETFLIFSPISRVQYEAVLQKREKRVDFWDSEKNEIWMTACTSASHESLHQELSDAIIYEAGLMGLNGELKGMGSTTYPVGGAEGSSGDADSSQITSISTITND